MLLDNGLPIKNPGSDSHSVFILRVGETAIVSIYRRWKFDQIDFENPVSQYETLSRGATASARREVRRIVWQED